MDERPRVEVGAMSAFLLRKNRAIVPLCVGLLLAGTTLAERHGGGGGGGGGGGSHSTRSFSGGGSNSSRSFSGGGSSSMRSFSSGGGGGSSKSFRSFSGSDSGSSRSFRSSSGGDSGSSIRSFSGGSSNQSFSNRSGIRSDFRPSVRSFDSNSSASNSTSGGNSSFRTMNSGPSSDNATRTFSDNSSGNSTRVWRTAPQQSSTDSGPSQNSFQARSGRSAVDQAQLQTYLNQQSGGKNSAPNSITSKSRTTFYGEQFGTNNNNRTPSDTGRNFQARRTTNEDVRSFLSMRDGNASQGAKNSNSLPGEKNVLKGNNLPSTFRSRGNGTGDGGNSLGSVGDRANTDGKQFKYNKGSNDQLNSSGNNYRARFNSNNSERGNKLEKHLNLDTSKGTSFGDGRGGGIDKGFARNGRDREFRGSDVARGEFKNWSNTWKGKNGNGPDHRDWSGKWRDGGRFDIAHDIRGDWHGRHDHDKFPFRGGWWGRDYHHHGWGFWNDYCVRWHRPWFWWSWTTAPVLYDWCGFGWSTPYYWDYGPGEYIYCYDGVVYVNGAWYQPAPVFYQQTVQMVEAAPVLAQEAAAQVEWLPLGVFAVTPDGLKEPSVMVQLAVTKDGVIGGTAFDQKAGKSYNIQGTVDKNTQRAVWSYTDDKNNRIVMETSVNNLTQNESTGLVHYSPNDMRAVELVRLQEPDAKPADQPGGALVPPQGN